MSAKELQREVMAVLRWGEAAQELGRALGRETLVALARQLADHMEQRARERGDWKQERYEAAQKEFALDGPLTAIYRRHGAQPS